MSRDIKTKADYDEFVAAFNAFMEREQIHPFSCGSLLHNYDDTEACTGEGHLHESDGSYLAEGYFSWQPCDCCGGTLGGNRYDVIAPHKTPEKDMDGGHFHGKPKLYEYSVCEDCVYFAEYGRLDDTKMLELGLT